MKHCRGICRSVPVRCEVPAFLRTGWLNYVLIGTETHRFHHSAEDHGNFGSAVAVWDLCFGTFVYDPSRVPNRLGLDVPADYPDPLRFHATLAWPLFGRR